MITMSDLSDIKKQIFSILLEDLNNNISTQKNKKCLKVMLKKQLDCFDEERKLETFPFSRKEIKSLVLDRDLTEKDLDNIHRYIQQSDLQSAIDGTIQNNSKYLELGFLPIVNSNRESDPNGGSSRERLFWLDVKAIDKNNSKETIQTESDEKNQEFDEGTPQVYSIVYDREEISNIKLSFFSKIVFE